MKYLIINADDFGASPGTNRGIVDAHRQGIVTSTSLMVDTPWSADASTLSDVFPDLSVGLHLTLDGLREGEGAMAIAGELTRQFQRFERLMGRPPTHIDSHHDRHSDPAVLPEVLRFSHDAGLPLRGHSAAHACSKFYGQWDGTSHPEQISVAGLERVLTAAVGGHDVVELSCHPGYVDRALHSTYVLEREIELETLRDPATRRTLAALDLHLIGFRELVGVSRAPAQGVAL